MLRVMMVIGCLVALVGGANAGSWNGLGSAVAGIEAQTQIEKVACGHDDFYCPYGRYRACSPNGQCWCNRCSSRNYWQRDPNYQYQPGPPGIMFNFGLGGGGGGDDRGRYSSPSRRWNTWNGCPPNYTVQDGVCKPYTGR